MVLKRKVVQIGLYTFGTVLVLLGVLIAEYWQYILWKNFERDLVLSPTSESFKKWRLTPIPLLMRVYFWNWTNPEDIFDEGYKPNFVEMGPYVYREVQEKVNVTWNENGTVSFQTVKRWYFDEKLTNGSLSDNITSINIIATSVSHISRTWSRMVLYPMSMILTTAEQKISWTKNVSQLLFEGFNNPIQKLASYLPGSRDMAKFGLFYGKNGTLPHEILNMDTGLNNISDIGQLRSRNYLNTSNEGGGPCSHIQGSLGEFWSPYLTKDEPLKMYNPEMCRQVRYYYEGESSYKKLTTYVFAGTKETVDNGTLVKDNICSCLTGECQPSGVIDVSSCSRGAPVYLSYPHFYNADPYYREAIQGMQPDESKHKFFMELEPKTGTPVNVRARIQMNLLLHKHPVLSMFRKVPTLYIPVMWVETEAALSDNIISGVALLLKLDSLGAPLAYSICGIGALIILLVATFQLCNCQSIPPFRSSKEPVNGKETVVIPMRRKKSKKKIMDKTPPESQVMLEDPSSS